MQNPRRISNKKTRSFRGNILNGLSHAGSLSSREGRGTVKRTDREICKKRIATSHRVSIASVEGLRFRLRRKSADNILQKKGTCRYGLRG